MQENGMGEGRGWGERERNENMTYKNPLTLEYIEKNEEIDERKRRGGDR